MILQRGSAQTGRIDRDIPPPDQPLAFDPNEMLEPLLSSGGGAGILRKEAHCNRIVAGLGQIIAVLLSPLAKQRVGDLDQAP